MIFDDSGRTRGTLTVSGPRDGPGRKFVGRSPTAPQPTSARKPSTRSRKGRSGWSSTSRRGGSGAGSSDPGQRRAEGRSEDPRTRAGLEGDRQGRHRRSADHALPRHPADAPSEVFGVKAPCLRARSRRLDRRAGSGAADAPRHLRLRRRERVSTTTEMTIDFVEFGRVPKIEFRPPDEVFNATSKIESQVQSAAEGRLNGRSAAASSSFGVPRRCLRARRRRRSRGSFLESVRCVMPGRLRGRT